MGTAEVESALVSNEKVAESAVVGYPHDIKGQGIYAYVTLTDNTKPTEELRERTITLGQKKIGLLQHPILFNGLQAFLKLVQVKLCVES